MTTNCIVAVTLYNPTFSQRVHFMRGMVACGMRKHAFSNVFSFETEGGSDCTEWLCQTTRHAAAAARIGYLTIVVQAGNAPASFHEHPPAKA